MKDIDALWKTDEHLQPLPMAIRAFIIFIIALILLRFGGIRIFGQKSALDSVIVIMFGAVMARGIVGASALHSTVIAAAMMVLTNRLIAWLCQKNNWFNSLIKGNAIILVEFGKIRWDAMKSVNLTETDLVESLRLETKSENLAHVEKAILETNGRISFILKKHSS